MHWNEGEVNYLTDNYRIVSSLDILSNNLKKSKKAITHKAARLGLSRERVPHNKPKDPNYRKTIDKRYYERHKTKIYLSKRARLRNYKLELVNELGGKCSLCGYNKCIAAFDFHHKSDDKESAVAFLLNHSSKEKTLKEARKCLLLCANCHRELHYTGL